jgi:hypothetical protein
MGVVPPSIVHLLTDFVNICPIYERMAAPHSRTGELMLLQCDYISWYCENWLVVTGSRKIISSKRAQALSSWTPPTLYIHESTDVF